MNCAFLKIRTSPTYHRNFITALYAHNFSPPEDKRKSGRTRVLGEYCDTTEVTDQCVAVLTFSVPRIDFAILLTMNVPPLS